MWLLTWSMFFLLFLFSPSFLGWGGAETQAFDAQTKEVVIHGQVEQINHPIAVVKGEDNQVYNVRLGPYSYWQKKGYELHAGEKVTVIGYLKGKLLFPKVIIASKGKKLLFRDENGVPLWKTHPH